jgi:hypothetical protein
MGGEKLSATPERKTEVAELIRWSALPAAVAFSSSIAFRAWGYRQEYSSRGLVYAIGPELPRLYV